MNYSFNDHVRSDKAKWWIVTICLLVVGVILCGLMTNWFSDMNPFCWFGHKYSDTGVCVRCGAEQVVEEKPVEDKPVEELPQASGNVVIQTASSVNMKLDSELVALAANTETYNLTATITPATADDKRVDWVATWKNASATWAVGKNVNDYVTVTPTSAHALTATVACIKDFGEQIIITVTSLDNSNVKATCTVDYVERITGFTFTMPTVSGKEHTFSCNIETSAYTLKSNISYSLSNRLALTENFKNEFAAGFDSRFSSYVCYSPAALNRQNNRLIINDGGDWDIQGEVDDYYYPDSIVGCFYCIDWTYIDYLGMGTDVQAFRKAANKVTTAHATFEVTYSATYNGKTYSSGSKTVEVRFDGAALHIPVNGMSLSQGSLVF